MQKVNVFNYYQDEFNHITWSVYRVDVPAEMLAILKTDYVGLKCFPHYEFFTQVNDQIENLHPAAQGNIDTHHFNEHMAKLGREQAIIDPEVAKEYFNEVDDISDEEYTLSMIMKTLMGLFNCTFYHSAQW